MKLSLKKMSQKGFLHLGTILPMVLVMVAVGGIGAYVLRKSHAAVGPPTTGGSAPTVRATPTGNGYLIQGSNATYYTGGFATVDPYTGLKSVIKLTDAKGVELANATSIDSIQWAPDGLHFFVVYRSSLSATYYQTLAVANYNGTNLTTVYKTPSLSSITYMRNPHWSPDSSKIAFVEGDTTNKLMVYGLTGTKISEALAPTYSWKLAWSPSGGSIFYSSQNSSYVYDVTSGIFSQDSKGMPAQQVAGYTDNSHVVGSYYDTTAKTTVIDYADLVTGSRTKIASTSSDYWPPVMSRDRKWVLSTAYNKGYLKLVSIDGAVVKDIPTGCVNIGSSFVSSDGQDVFFVCRTSAAAYISTKQYNIASDTVTIAKGKIDNNGGDNGVNAPWQPGASRVSSKSCTSGSYSMKSEQTFNGLIGGLRTMPSLKITPLVGTTVQAKKVDYTITIQTLKSGVWTTVKTYGAATTTTSGTFTLDPADTAEYAIGGTRVIISSGVYGDNIANCSVTHYSS